MADFNPKIGEPVPKAEAEAWIEAYNQAYRKDKQKDTISVFYGRDIIESLLKQEGCAGITFYLVSKKNADVGKDTVQLVLVGRKQDGTLLWGTEGAGKDSYPGAVDNGLTCPVSCN